MSNEQSDDNEYGWPDKRRPHAKAKIPYGYRASEDDPCVLVVDTDLLPVINEAFDHLDSGSSYREAAAWLSAKTGKALAIRASETSGSATDRLKQLVLKS